MYERVVGKRLNDIELPNESGKTDPRLEKDANFQVRKKGVINAAGPNIKAGIKVLQDKGLIGKRSPGGSR